MSDDTERPVMGQLAAQDRYDPPITSPFDPRNDVASMPTTNPIATSLAQTIATPGSVMRTNPYPQGSEEADYYDAMRTKAMTDWAPQMALNTMGTGAIAGVPVKGGEFVAGMAARPRAPSPPIGHNNPPPEFQFSQYAEQYPPVGPPVTRTDPKKAAAGVADPTYQGKQLTPEAIAFQAARGKIIEDMKTGGYTPYFSPDERFHVDPANYPPNVDTMTITPKKQATIDKYWTGTEDKPGLDSELVRDRLRAAYQRGGEMPNTKDWYAMGQLEKAFIDELGPEEGRKAFQNRFATSMAATTGGADPTANYLMAQYGNYLRAKGLPTPEAHQFPFPIGGQYAGNNMRMFDKVMNEGGFPGLGAANPKRHNFAQNFTGNRDVATMDEQMTSGMTPGVAEPGERYGLYEKVLRQEAAKAGVPPANYQDVGWAGFKNIKDPTYTEGKPMISHVNDAIERTHRLTGMSRDEIMKRGVVRSEIPIYALAAGVMAPGVMGALADQSGYREP